MKKTLALVFLIVCLAAQPAQAVKKKAPATPDTVEVPGKVITEPNAFHGVKWGTPMAAVPDLTGKI